MINIPSKNISKLNLSNQNLTDFPKEILELKNLKKLNLSGNKISSIPKEIEQLKHLQVLDVSNNQINNFHSKICSLRRLKVLNLNNNSIKTIPRQLGELKELEILQIASNLIQSIPESFKNLYSLKELNLSKNKFTQFPEEILKLGGLKTLWLNNLEFQSFPIESISQMKNLQSLFCFSLMQKNKIDEKYLMLAEIKGNCISKLKLLSNVSILEKSMPTNKHKNENINPKKIFISYSHKDLFWLEQVKMNLKVLHYNDVDFELWDDTKMKGSEKWKTEISKALENSGIAILIISTHFLTSEFIRNQELPTLLSNAENHGTKILPLIVRPCYFTKDKLSIYQAVNDPNKPLSSLSESEWERELVTFTGVVADLLVKL